MKKLCVTFTGKFVVTIFILLIIKISMSRKWSNTIMAYNVINDLFVGCADESNTKLPVHGTITL